MSTHSPNSPSPLSMKFFKNGCNGGGGGGGGFLLEMGRKEGSQEWGELYWGEWKIYLMI